MTAMGDSSKEPEVSEITFPDHLNAVNASYMDFFVNEKFTDILLGSSGGALINCHKVVLAASSYYFDNMLSSPAFNHQSPCVVVLSSVSTDHLKKLLCFAYSGHVAVAATEIQSFAESFNFLRMKGGMIETARKDDKEEQAQKDGKDENNNIMDTSQPNTSRDAMLTLSAVASIELENYNNRTPARSSRMRMQTPRAKKTYSPISVNCPVCNKLLSKSYIAMHLKTQHKDDETNNSN